MTTAEKVKLTEADMLRMLRDRYTETGNGGSGAYAFLTQVRDEAGFSARRTIDAIAMSLWKSRGLEIHGHEVKVSRSDWLRELKDPAKADGFFQRCDRWWLVVSDAGFVKEGELPAAWGLMAVRGGKVVVVKQAPLNKERTEDITRSWLVGLLRAAGAVPGSRQVEPEEIRAAKNEGYENGQRLQQMTVESLESRLKHFETLLREERKVLREFELAAGFSITDHQYRAGGDKSREVGEAVKAVLNGDKRVEQAQANMRNLAAQARRIADQLDSTP